MKLRLKKRQGALAKAVACSVELRDPISGLLPFVLGRSLITGQEPRQVLLGLNLYNTHEILEFWFRTGYIKGVPEMWNFSTELMNGVRQQLRVTSTLSFRPEKAEKHSLRFLVSLYAQLRKQQPGKVADYAPRSRANIFRILCLAYPTINMEDMVRNFFKQLGTDFSLQHFQKYVVAHAKVKPAKYSSLLLAR